MKKLGQICSWVIAIIWRFLPWKVNKLLGKSLAFLWIDVLGVRRQVINDNLEIAFPNMPLEKKTEIARASMVSLCRSFFDVMKIPSLTTAWIEKNVQFHGLGEFQHLKSKHQKVLFLTLHLGSGDLSAAVLSQTVIPCSLITKKFRSAFLDSFWFSLRSRSLTEFIDAHSSKNVFEILGALKRNRGIFFVLDQFMGKPYGVESTFFGVKTGTAYGLALFAKKTKVPVVPIYTFWDDKDKLHIYIEPAIDLSAEFSDTKNDTNAAITNKFNRALEKIISNHPHHWMWVHRRWKTFE
ncbi:MAG: lipid A biosynthesis lauroyl acyltransferase [Bdellovibrionaceae bacterium]|nr:lipid A biosynthesis lauroyl acyltransferase [Bdellovibrio sp.]